MSTTDLDLGKYQLGWSDEEDYVFKPKKGLNEDIIREMSAIKKEPEWMRDFRLAALKRFDRRPMAKWFAVNMPDLDFDERQCQLSGLHQRRRPIRQRHGGVVRAQQPDQRVHRGPQDHEGGRHDAVHHSGESGLRQQRTEQRHVPRW